MRCFKFKPTLASCPIGQLPKERVTHSFPFQVTGVDYAGPILIKDSSKTVHLEPITDLTSDNFLACLKRFVSRPEIP